MIKVEDIKKFEDDIISYRRYFHMYPEVGFEEIKTSKKVEEVLEELDIEVIKGIAETGVVGILKGKDEGGGIDW